MDPIPPQLDYQPLQTFQEDRRRLKMDRLWRRLKWYAIAIGPFLVSIGIWRLTQMALDSIRWHDWKNQCLAYVAPANQVVYEEDPNRQVAIVQSGGGPIQGYFQNPIHGAMSLNPKCWTSFSLFDSGMPFNQAPVVFLHERSVNGASRLVALIFDGWLRDDCWYFESNIYGNGSEGQWNYYQVDVGAGLKPGSLRFFAGQLDPSDASHFKVGYELNGEKGTVEGWLKPDDSVTLKVHDVPATMFLKD